MMTQPTDVFVLTTYRQVCMCGQSYSHSQLSSRTAKGLKPAHTRPTYRPFVIALPVEHISLCEACYATLPERPKDESEPWRHHARASWREPVTRPGNIGGASAKKTAKFELSMLDNLLPRKDPR